MRLVPVFLGEVKEKKLRLKNPERYKRFIEKLEGKEVYVTVEKKRKHRTLSQNALYHLWVRVIADELGEEESEDVCYFLKKILMPEKWGGIKEIKGEIVPVIPSTKDWSVDEMMDFMTKVQFWAGKEGIILPDPEEIKNNPQFISK